MNDGEIRNTTSQQQTSSSSIMPKPASTLSNCYIPLPLSSSLSLGGGAAVGDEAAGVTDKQQQVLPRRKRRDAGDGPNNSSSSSRSAHGLRRLVLQSTTTMNNDSAATAVDATNNNANINTGSTYVELGHTKVMCQVLAPLSSSCTELPSNTAQQLDMDQGTLVCQVKYVPQIAYPTCTLLANSVSTVETNNMSNTNNNHNAQSSSQQQQTSSIIMSAGKMNSWIMMREADLSARLHAALAAAVPLQQYPKCAILVKITILQDDGSILPACITAASLALVDAAVEVYDVVTACSVAVVQTEQEDKIEVWADPTLEEEMDPSTLSVMTLAILPNWKHVTIWEQYGPQPLSPDLANRTMEICRDGCRTMHLFMRQHLIQQQEQEQEHQQGDDDDNKKKQTSTYN